MATHLMACEVFRDELTQLFAELHLEIPVSYFEMGLHDNPVTMRQRLQAQIASLELEPKLERVIFAYGVCGGGLQGLTSQRLTLVAPYGHDCISVLMGNRREHEKFQKEQPQSYFLSNGWLKSTRIPGPQREAWIREHYADQDQDDLDDLLEADRSAFSHYKQIVLVETECKTSHRNRAEESCQSMGWTLSPYKGSLSWLRDLLMGEQCPDRFVTARPGEALKFTL
jgi:hypothetical protein